MVRSVTTTGLVLAACLLGTTAAVPVDDGGSGLSLVARQAGSFIRYSGCFGSSETWRTDPASSGLTIGYQGADNGIARCSAACSTSSHFILWDQDCFCGNLVIDEAIRYIASLDAWEATEGDCWRRCAGEPGVTCGGSMRAAFYARTDPPTPQDPGIAVVPGFHWMGCYPDNVPDRNLPHHAQSADDMTPAKCAALCPDSNFIGVEYGRECWCGPLLTYNYKTFNRLCPMPCPGDASALCGGRNHLTLYERDDATPPDAPVGNYDYVGCYTDNGPNGRALQHVSSSDHMTLELCAETAAAGNYKYFGVEFGRECWTGATLNPLHTLASDPHTCKRQCAGDGGQVCGGPDRLNLYIRRGQPAKTCQRAANSPESLACGIRGFAPPPGARPATATVDSAAKCAAACAAATGCQSSIWTKATGLCRIYDVGVWTAVGNVAQAGAGGEHRDVFADDVGCWTCQDAV